jgi:hypothetical protein
MGGGAFEQATTTADARTAEQARIPESYQVGGGCAGEIVPRYVVLRTQSHNGTVTLKFHFCMSGG